MDKLATMAIPDFHHPEDEPIVLVTERSASWEFKGKSSVKDLLSFTGIQGPSINRSFFQTCR